MSANNLLLGLGDNKDRNYTYIVKGISTDTRELVKVVNATGVATTIYIYPAGYYCEYTLHDDNYIYSVMSNPTTLSYCVYKTHKTTYVTTNSSLIYPSGYFILEIPASGFVGDYIVLSFYNTLYTVKIHKQTLVVSTYNSNSFIGRTKCLLPNGNYSYAFSSNTNGTCTWYKYDTFNFSLHSTGTFSNFIAPYEESALESVIFQVVAVSNTRLMLYYSIGYDIGYNVIDVGAGSPVLLRGTNSVYKRYYIQNSNKKANDSNWLYGLVYPPIGLGKYSNTASGTTSPINLLEATSYVEPIYYDNALYTVNKPSYKDVYRLNLLNGNFNKLFTLVGNYDYSNSYLCTMLVSNK